MKFTLESLQPPDFPKVAEMAREIWPEAYRSIISAEQIEFMLGEMYSVGKIERETRSGDAHYFWILRGQVHAGFTAFGPLVESRACEIHKLYVLPDYHRSGAGRSTISHIETTAREQRSSHLELRVNRNNTRAIAFYEACGFTKYATDCKDIGNGFVMDDFILHKRLDNEKGFPS